MYKKIIETYTGKKIRIMEVCGTHTHEIFRLGLRKILPENIELISGPGCPVCVTQAGYIDEAVYLALEKKVAVCTFGDLIRVPGTKKSLAAARAEGAEIHTVYSPLDTLELAELNPQKEFVFLSVGFETTVPASCLAVKNAKKRNIKNVSLLTANKTMPNAYKLLKNTADVFLYPGHVHAIVGTSLCEQQKEQGISGVIAGFTANDLMYAFASIIELSQKGQPFFKNCYERIVKPEGNKAALKIIEEIMIPCDAEWRGLGVIPQSGLQLKNDFIEFDARKKFCVPKIEGHSNLACRCGEVLRGICKPCDCPLFGKVCSPQKPVGACMVSNEGACSAYFQYGEKI